MISKPEIILVGGGGHCHSVIDVIETESRFRISGIVDLKEKIGDSVFGYPIIACDDDIIRLAKEYQCFLVTAGQIQSSDLRIKLYNLLTTLNVRIPVIISPYAYTSKHSSIGTGSVIMHHATVNAGSRIGINCIINTNAIIEHESLVGDHCHISTGTIINGNCNIENKVFIGSNSVIHQGIHICESAIIGAGSVMTKNITEEGVYFGNPAKKIR